jgi:voltage-gated potassium channel Kch
MNQKYLVVDYDPEIIEHLEAQGIRHAYGDATDIEFLDEIGVDKAQLVVCTIPEFNVNQELLHYLEKENPKAAFICHANSYDEAIKLYQFGASYVMLPHFLGSERISTYIKNHGIKREAFEHYRQKHLSSLDEKTMLNPDFGTNN